MHKIIITTAAMLLMVMPFVAVNAAAPEIGQPAPEIEATDIEGKTFKLSDHKGKTIVLEWSNHDCPFVRKHYDSGNMQQVQKTARTQGVEWVTIVSSAEGRQGHVSAQEAAAIVKDKGASISTKILDPSGLIGKAYDAKTTPHMFIVNPEGILVYAGAIDDNSSPNPATIKGAQNYILAALDDLKSGNEIRTAQTQPYGCSVKYSY